MFAKQALWVVYGTLCVPAATVVLLSLLWSLALGWSLTAGMFIAAALVMPALLFSAVVAFPCVVLLWALYRPQPHQFLPTGAVIGVICGATLGLFPPFAPPGLIFSSFSLAALANVVVGALAIGLPAGLLSAALIIALLPRDKATSPVTS